jgi:hypothetical protein
MSFAKLLTTVLLAAYTLAAPLGVTDALNDVFSNTVSTNAITSIEGECPEHRLDAY